MDNSNQTTFIAADLELRDILCTLWKGRGVIAVITLVCTLAAAAYAFLSPPIYRASVTLLPPSASGVAPYNVANQLTGPAINSITNQKEAKGVPLLTSLDAYKIFQRHFNSTALRLSFFNDTYLPAHQEGEITEARREFLWNQLQDELTIKLPKQDGDITTLTLEGTDPKLISTWANAFTLKAIELARSELVNDLVTAVDIRKHSNNDQIQALRQVAAETKRDQIARLTDALKIAQAVGLETPPSTGNLITDYKDDTMYLRGTRALQADLERLNARENNDAYIPELSDLLRVQALLNSINLAPENLAVAKVDSAASPPVNPVKPKKTLSLALGVFLGMLLGVGVVIVRKTLAAR